MSTSAGSLTFENITKIKKDEKNILHTGNHSIFDTDSKL